MGKRKFKMGNKIVSLDEMARQEHIYFHEKIYHCGWFGSWRFRWVAQQIQRGAFRYAIREGEQNEKV